MRVITKIFRDVTCRENISMQLNVERALEINIEGGTEEGNTSKNENTIVATVNIIGYKMTGKQAANDRAKCVWVCSVDKVCICLCSKEFQRRFKQSRTRD